MNKDIQKELDLLNDIKFTTAKINRREGGLATINKNRTKESCSKGGKIGGKTTGKKIKNGEKIGFFSIPMEERIEKYFSKPRPNRRLLSETDIEYIKKIYYRPVNQFDEIPKGKKSIKDLIEQFNVSKNVILNAIKRG